MLVSGDKPIKVSTNRQLLIGSVGYSVYQNLKFLFRWKAKQEGYFIEIDGIWMSRSHANGWQLCLLKLITFKHRKNFA